MSTETGKGFFFVCEEIEMVIYNVTMCNKMIASFTYMSIGK